MKTDYISAASSNIGNTRTQSFGANIVEIDKGAQKVLSKLGDTFMDSFEKAVPKIKDVLHNGSDVDVRLVGKDGVDNAFSIVSNVKNQPNLLGSTDFLVEEATQKGQGAIYLINKISESIEKIKEVPLTIAQRCEAIVNRFAK